MNAENQFKEYVLTNDYYDNTSYITLVEDSTQSSYFPGHFTNSFCVFNSVHNICYLIYKTKINSIISFNITTNNKVNEIYNAHPSFIYYLKHYQDKINNRDLILSLSPLNIKIWNVNDFNCILNLKDIYKYSFIKCACFVQKNKDIYIVTGTCDSRQNYASEHKRVYDLNGQKISEFESNRNTYFIDTYYEAFKYAKGFTSYLIIGNNGSSSSYIFHEQKYCSFYKIYSIKDASKSEKNPRLNVIVFQDEDKIVKLIDNNRNYLRIWNFHEGSLIHEIHFSGLQHLLDMYLWDNKYLLISTGDECNRCIHNSKIVLIDLKYRYHKDNFLDGKNKCLCSLTKIDHPKYKESLIFHCKYNSIALCKLEYCKTTLRNVTCQETMDFESFFEEYKKTHKNFFEKDNDNILGNNIGIDIKKEKPKKESKKCSIY